MNGLDFEAGAKEIAERVGRNLLSSTSNHPMLVLVGGGSGSGKSFFSKKLVSELDANHIEMDMFYNGELVSKILENSHPNFDHPGMVKISEAAGEVKKLLSGGVATVPVYTFSPKPITHYTIHSLSNSRVVVVEGLYALDEQLASLSRNVLTVGIQSNPHLDLVRRLVRDVSRTGNELDKILAQVVWTVYPSFLRYVQPLLEKAELQLVNNFNPLDVLETREVDLKASLSEEKFVELVSNSKVLKVEHHFDEFFSPPNAAKEKLRDLVVVREVLGNLKSIFLSFKGGNIGNGVLQRPTMRIETDITILTGLKAMGYEKLGSLSKQRTFANFNGLSLKFDYFEGWQKFVELTVPADEIVEAKQSLMQQLDLQENDFISKSYAQLVTE